MAYAKSDQVKQFIDNLEKYRLFTEDKLFIHKESDQCGSLLRKIMLDGETYHLLAQLTLTVEERNSLVVYSKSFSASVVQSWSGLHRMLTDLCFLFSWFDSWLLHFSWTEHSLEAIKACNPFKISCFFLILFNQFILESLREGQYKWNEQWSSQPLSRVQKVKTY